jgi:hypothetical protein
MKEVATSARIPTRVKATERDRPFRLLGCRLNGCGCVGRCPGTRPGRLIRPLRGCYIKPCRQPFSPGVARQNVASLLSSARVAAGELRPSADTVFRRRNCGVGRNHQEELMTRLTALALATMALCLPVALPAGVAFPATGDRAPGASSGTATPAKGWIKLSHNAGTPQKPVNKPIYVNVSQICMVSDSKNEAPRRYGTFIQLAGGNVYVLESVDEVINAINASNSSPP